ncbi:MAG: hypothetical protein ACTSRS_00890 [Candidatus Helarchaeota archaeon]
MQDDVTTIDYIIRELMASNNTITAATVLTPEGQVVYQTSNWDISSDVIGLLNSWRQQAPSVVVQGIKYSTLQCTPERLVSTNILGQGHIVASSERNRILLAYVTPDGGAGVAYMDVARALSQITGGGAAQPAAAPAPTQVSPQPPTSYQQPPSYEQAQVYQQPQQPEQTQYTPTQEQMRPVPKSSWSSSSPSTEMKNIIWEVEEFRKYVERGDFEAFLRNLLSEGDQVKIWEILKLIRHFKSLTQIE